MSVKSRKLVSLMAFVLCIALMTTMIIPMASASTAESVTTVLSPWGKIVPPVNTPLAARPASLSDANIGIIYFDRLGGLEIANAIEANLNTNTNGLTIEKTKLDQIRLTPKETGLTDNWFDAKAVDYDAVIIDVADTTNTAYWAAVYVREFESRAVPAVVLTTSNFLAPLNVSAEAHGITALRSVAIPNGRYALAFTNIAADSAAIIDDEGYGAQLLAQLTTPLTQEEINPAPIMAPHQETDYTLPALRYSYLLQFFLDFSLKEGFGDGLPLTLPTRDAVDEMLAGTERAPDEVLGTLRYRYGIMTVENVAVNAVMAGADPKYFPVILASMEAIIDGIEDDSLFHYAWTSGDDYSLMILVNGPIADELEFYAERSFTQAARDAQLTIGRAVRLAFQNIGHNTKGDVNTGRYGATSDHAGYVFTENTLQAPGSTNPQVYKWEPHHVSMGFEEGDSVVTIAAIGRWAETQNTVPGWFTQELSGYLVMPGHFMLRGSRIHDYANSGGFASMSNSHGYGVSSFESLPVNPTPSRDFTLITYNPDNISNLLEAPETNGGTSTAEIDFGLPIPAGAQLSVKMGLGTKQNLKDWFATHGLAAGQRTGPGATGSFATNMSNVSSDPGVAFAAHANVVNPIVSGEVPSYARVMQSKYLGMDAVRSQQVTGATLTDAGRAATVPSQPLNIGVIQTGKGEITLSWDAPARADAITGYEVSANGGITWEDAGNNTTYVLTGLAAGTDTFLVRAVSGIDNARVYDNDTFEITNRGSGRGAQASEVYTLATALRIEGAALVTLRKNATMQLTATKAPTGAMPGIVWSSSNPAWVTVDESGLVTGIMAGKSAIITATTAGGTISSIITVRVTA